MTPCVGPTRAFRTMWEPFWDKFLTLGASRLDIVRKDQGIFTYFVLKLSPFPFVNFFLFQQGQFFWQKLGTWLLNENDPLKRSRSQGGHAAANDLPRRSMKLTRTCPTTKGLIRLSLDLKSWEQNKYLMSRYLLPSRQNLDFNKLRGHVLHRPLGRG